MNRKVFASLCIAGVLLASDAVFSQTPAQPKQAAADQRIEKLIEQNQQILKNQEEILKRLDKIEQGLMQLRRRTG